MDRGSADLLEWQNAVCTDELFSSSTVSEPVVSFNPRYQDNTIVKLTFSFAQAIWDLSAELDDRRKYAVSNRLFRSDTGIGVLVRDAQNGESLADFVHKMKIALKEADETEYRLLLCQSRDITSATTCLEKLLPIIRILNKIISTSKAKFKK